MTYQRNNDPLIPMYVMSKMWTIYFVISKIFKKFHDRGNPDV